jgi:hypothetical protein
MIPYLWRIRFGCVAALVVICVCLHSDGIATSVVRPSAGIRFARGHRTPPIPFELIGNHIYLRVKVNGSRALWFLLDTGATQSYLDVEQSRALHLEAGADSAALDLPGVHIPHQPLTFVPLTFGIYDGHPVHGLLGYDFLSRFVVAIDYPRRQLTLHRPESYVYTGRGHELPLTLLEDDSGGKVPLVRVSIHFRDGRETQGRFIADTGARLPLSINSPFARDQRVLGSLPAAVRMVVGGGALVRDVRLALGRARSIELAEWSLPDPVVGVSEDTTGILASPEFDGVLGGEVLRRFRVAFDYSRSRAILESTSAIEDPFETDMSGAFLIAEGPEFRTVKVRTILSGSPAAEAGLQPGDIMERLDGQDVSRLPLDVVRQMFREDGRTRLLRIRRGAATLKLTLRLRRLV